MHGFHGALATRLQVVETERAGFADQAVNGQSPLRRVDAGNTEMSKNEDVLACGDGAAHLVRAQFDAAQSARRIHRRPGRIGTGDLLVRHRGCTPPALSVDGLLQRHGTRGANRNRAPPLQGRASAKVPRTDGRTCWWNAYRVRSVPPLPACPRCSRSALAHAGTGTGHHGTLLFGVRRGLDCPARIGAERMIHEEHPGAVRQPAVDLHAVMMQLGRHAVLVEARDQPL